MKIVTYCGLDCANCEAYIATRENDNRLKARVALRWSKIYHRQITPEEVFCNGCKSGGTKGIYCHSMCKVKPCCKAKGLATCAGCGDFPCDKLKEIFIFDREAETKLRDGRN